MKRGRKKMKVGRGREKGKWDGHMNRKRERKKRTGGRKNVAGG